MSHVAVYTREQCHLCEAALAQVAAIAPALGASWEAIDVDGDPEIRAEFGDLVPVIMVDGVLHGYYRVEPDRLRRALGG